MRATRLVLQLRRHQPTATVLTYNVDPVGGAVVSRLSGAAIRIGPNAPGLRHFFTHHLPHDQSPKPPFHKVEYACMAAALIGRKANRSVHISVPDDQVDDLCRRAVGATQFPLIAIALGCGVKESHKRLPTGHAHALINGLAEKYVEHTLVLLGGEPERDLNANLAKEGAPGRLLNLTGKTSTVELLAVLKRSKVLYSTCNGVSHVAAAAGCPVIGFYGPTNRQLTGPFGVPVTEISRGLSCSPCYTRKYSHGCGNPICMEVDIERAIEAGACHLKVGATC